MQISDIGEFGFIDKIIASQRGLKLENGLGIGDDCAVIPSRLGYSYLITSDMLIEGKHFLLKHITPYELGYKSLGVSLSDIAAMGATPLYSFMSISIPPVMPTEWIDGFLEGYNSFGIPLLGGDTTSANEGSISISITVIGECRNENIKYRSSAQNGDHVVVTGHLGSSAAGLRALNKDGWSTLKKAHHTPHIDIKEGEWLGKRDEVNAMMDISDGVSSDLRHICKRSLCGAKIEIDKLPMEDEYIEFCAKNSMNPTELALSGGEDYKLLFTVKKGYFDSLNKDFKDTFCKELFVIGEIDTTNKIRYIKEDVEIDIKSGFTHF